jgi:hypothetical protein
LLVVIDVRPDSLIDPKVAKVFDVTASACREVEPKSGSCWNGTAPASPASSST